MSHTNHTQYYNIPQYAGSDIINPLVDTNGAYEAIDTAMHNIATEAAQDTADVAALQNKVGSGVFGTTAQNATDAVNELVGELDTADTGIKARLTTAESEIDTLQSQMVTAQGNITTLQNKVADLSNYQVVGLGDYEIVSVKGDGVKTWAELIADLKTAMLAKINSSDEAKNAYMNISLGGYIGFMNSCDLHHIVGPGVTALGRFEAFDISDGTNVIMHYVNADNAKFFTATNGTVTEGSSNVAPDNATIAFYGVKLTKI